MTDLLAVGIVARDLGEAWWKCLRACLTHGYEYTITRGSHNVGQKRKEFDFITVRVLHPGTRPLAPIVPEGVPPPTTDQYIQEYLTYLLAKGKKEGEEYTYGEYIEDQYLKCIGIYSQVGEFTNHACMTVGDMHSIDLNDPPCLRVIDTRVRYGKLHWFVYFRSWDLWAGFPTNMGGLQLAKEMMAAEIGVGDGELIATSKGLHLYENTWELAKITCGLPNQQNS